MELRAIKIILTCQIIDIGTGEKITTNKSVEGPLFIQNDDQMIYSIDEGGFIRDVYTVFLREVINKPVENKMVEDR